MIKKSGHYASVISIAAAFASVVYFFASIERHQHYTDERLDRMENKIDQLALIKTCEKIHA